MKSVAALVLLAATAAAQEIRWHDATGLRLEGKAWADTAAPFDRLPARAEKLVRPAVWTLSRDSAGMCVGFRTDAPEIRVAWTLIDDQLAMAHMPATGVSGIDLYVRHEGRWRWLATGRPTQFPRNERTLIDGLEPLEREYLLYLPLYNGVSDLRVGVPDGSALAASEPRTGGIVFYGTSITHGGCASRPGMTHVAIIGRRLDRPVVNLGFSGNGKMEPELAHLLGELDPDVVVLDCIPNMTGKLVTERFVPFVEILREARPTTPILVVEDRTYQDAFLDRERAQRNRQSREALRKAHAELVARGFEGLHYVEGDALLGDDGEATVDGSHPTDLGFVRQADVLEKALREALQ